jgi:hypothetical protein
MLDSDYIEDISHSAPQVTRTELRRRKLLLNATSKRPSRRSDKRIGVAFNCETINNSVRRADMPEEVPIHIHTPLEKGETGGVSGKPDLAGEERSSIEKEDSAQSFARIFSS